MHEQMVSVVPGWVPVIVGILALFGLVVLGLFLNYGYLWLRALVSDAYVGWGELIGMTLRGVKPGVVVDARIRLKKSGLEMGTGPLETHYLAGGHLLNVVQAIISAAKADISLAWDRACAIDLAGRDVGEAVRLSVNPEVIDCPDPSKGRTTIDAVAMDGIQLKARARVTVRANLNRLVGGATEETIIARVGEGTVTTIGSATSHKLILENPDLISERTLAKGLDAGTAFEILSIDIADIDVGDNIGAKLQVSQAEADMRVAQAKAEERRAMAGAHQQEMMALVQENRAKVVLAEAEVPKAMAQAFRQGNLGIGDHYQARQLVADADVRNATTSMDEQLPEADDHSS